MADSGAEATVEVSAENVGENATVEAGANLGDNTEVEASVTVPDPTTETNGDPDRLAILENIVTALSETVEGVVKQLTDQSPDVQPQKLPWTAWGGKK